jgi:hypothetical protein
MNGHHAMNCAAVETAVCDYLDGTLAGGERTAFEEHLKSCDSCTELLNDSREAMAFIERCAEVTPPPELLTRIIHQLPDARRDASRRSGWKSWASQLFQPILQPRFAMGMAMTILSFSMLGKFVGPVKPIQPSDLNPVRVVESIDQRLHRAFNEAVKYYESLRVVYEIQSLLREWSAEEEQESGQEASPESGSSSQPNAPKKGAERPSGGAGEATPGR